MVDGPVADSRAEAMRRILVEKAFRRQSANYRSALNRSGRSLDELQGGQHLAPAELLAVHEAQDRLALNAPRIAELVKLRFFLA
jgi:hypothetical protein